MNTQTLEIEKYNETDEISVSRFGKLPTILRGIGIGAVLLSLYGFFMKGWEGSDDLIRYLMLFGHTILLAVIGFASGHILKEGKGARILMMLSLVSVIANYAILGAFLYAGYGEPLSHGFVSAMKWQLDSGLMAISLAFVTNLFLVPIILLGFRVLGRGMSKKMSFLFIVSNLLLLIPLRQPELIAFMTCTLAGVMCLVTAKTRSERTEAKTFEGVVALLLQFAPIVTLLGRNIWLYQDANILYMSAFAVSFIALRQLCVFAERSNWLTLIAELVSGLIAIMMIFAAGATMDDLGLGHSLEILVAVSFSAVMLFELSSRAYQFEGLYRNLGAFVLTSGVICNVLFVDDAMAVGSALVIGTWAIIESYKRQQKTLLFTGSIIDLIACYALLDDILFNFDINAWMLCATLGIVAIVAGSFLETRGDKIREYLGGFRSHYNI